MTGWTVIVGHAAQKDLWTFPWSQDVEVGGVVMGRFECSGINRSDTGKHLFIRRIFPSDRGGDGESVTIDYDAVFNLQTIKTRSRPGHGGRFGADDPGVIVGCIHSHPGLDRQRDLSPTDTRVAAANAANAPAALAGKPFLSAIVTSGEAWREGYPEEDWSTPTVDHYLIFGDRTIVRPRIYMQREIEWLCEERQRQLIAADSSGQQPTQSSRVRRARSQRCSRTE